MQGSEDGGTAVTKAGLSLEKHAWIAENASLEIIVQSICFSDF